MGEKNSSTTLLLVLVLGLVLLFVSMKCSFTCSVSEKFGHHGLVDYAYDEIKPSYHSDGELVKGAPLHAARSDAPYVGHAGHERDHSEHNMGQGCVLHS